jgi:hypothetical protein
MTTRIEDMKSDLADYDVLFGDHLESLRAVAGGYLVALVQKLAVLSVQCLLSEAAFDLET